jgi:hypothetical protein
MKNGILGLLAPIAATFYLATCTTSSFACNAGKTIFADTFQTLDPSWGAAASDKGLFVDAGTLVVKPNPGYYRQPLSQSDYYGDGDLCTETNFIDNPDASQTEAGVIFWGSDYDNFYLFRISGLGTYGVARRSHGKWLTPINWTSSSAIKQGTNQWNELDVQMKGNQAILFINGTQVAQFNGTAPDGGGLIGVDTSGAPNGVTTIRFRNFKMVAPTAFKPPSQ